MLALLYLLCVLVPPPLCFGDARVPHTALRMTITVSVGSCPHAPTRQSTGSRGRTIHEHSKARWQELRGQCCGLVCLAHAGKHFPGRTLAPPGAVGSPPIQENVAQTPTVSITSHLPLSFEPASRLQLPAPTSIGSRGLHVAHIQRSIPPLNRRSRRHSIKFGVLAILPAVVLLLAGWPSRHACRCGTDPANPGDRAPGVSAIARPSGPTRASGPWSLGLSEQNERVARN